MAPEINLLPGESISRIDPIPIRPIANLPTPLQGLMMLTSARRAEDIGKRGIAIAARAMPEHRGVKALQLFEAEFGRDSAIIAMFTHGDFPALDLATVMRHAELQGVRYDDAGDEEPGKGFHENRKPGDSIRAELERRKSWSFPYYGSYDSALLFSILAARVIKEQGFHLLGQTYIGTDGQKRSLHEAYYRSLQWASGEMERNPEGLIESRTNNPKGHTNPFWKDSWDSYFHKEGTIANQQNKASIEIQALAIQAFLNAADLYEKIPAKEMTHPAQWYEIGVGALRQRGERLRRAIMAHFWDEAGGFLGLGTDRDEENKLRLMRIKTSNMGQALIPEIFGNDNGPEFVYKRESVIRHLFSLVMLGTSGIRTLAEDEYRFRPGAYHNGSVWPWDNRLISEGLERLGYYGLSTELDRRIRNAIDTLRLYPELVLGTNSPTPEISNVRIVLRDELHKKDNIIQQPPQPMQGWTIAAAYSIFRKSRVGVPTKALDDPKRRFEDRILERL